MVKNAIMILKGMVISMFVPMFKGREKVEYKAIKAIRQYFSDQVIPLIEILKENHKKEIDYDPITKTCGKPTLLKVGWIAQKI